MSAESLRLAVLHLSFTKFIYTFALHRLSACRFGMYSLTAARSFRPHPSVAMCNPVISKHTFHQWVPGKMYSPVPLKHVDLHTVYDQIIREYVNQNLTRFSEHFGVPPISNKLLARVKNFAYMERDSVKAERQNSPKQPRHMMSSPALLNALYAKKLQKSAVISALDQLPGADQNRQASCIPAEHLETLINVSMDKSRLWVKVFTILEASSLPTTSREKAQYIYQCWRQTQSTRMPVTHDQIHEDVDSEKWRSELRRLWPHILASRDISAFNILLKLAFRARCRETQNLVEYHLQTADRFTYLTKLRSFPPSAAPDLLRSFSEQRFVMDISIFSSFISKMLRSRNKQHVTMAENRFERVLSSTKLTKPVCRSKTELALQLKTMDRLNQIIGNGDSGIQLPVYTDARLFSQMYSHYIRQNKHSEALKVVVAMSQMDEIPPRHIIYEHIRNREAPHHILVSLFYLCCDVNILHPNFISTSMAKVWASVIAERGEISLEEAVKLVDRSREPVTM